jgi:hypothetical protein
MVPFGFSVSDFLAGIKLLKTSIESFSETRGARADYAELSKSVSSLQRALTAASAVDLETDTQRDALKLNVDGCRDCVNTFLIDIAKFHVLTRKRQKGRSLLACGRYSGRCSKKRMSQSLGPRSRLMWVPSICY